MVHSSPIYSTVLIVTKKKKKKKNVIVNYWCKNKLNIEVILIKWKKSKHWIVFGTFKMKKFSNKYLKICGSINEMKYFYNALNIDLTWVNINQ